MKHFCGTLLSLSPQTDQVYVAAPAHEGPAMIRIIAQAISCFEHHCKHELLQPQRSLLVNAVLRSHFKVKLNKRNCHDTHEDQYLEAKAKCTEKHTEEKCNKDKKKT